MARKEATLSTSTQFSPLLSSGSRHFPPSSLRSSLRLCSRIFAVPLVVVVRLAVSSFLFFDVLLCKLRSLRFLFYHSSRAERECPRLLIGYGEATLSEGEESETGKWKGVRKKNSESVQAFKHSTVIGSSTRSPMHVAMVIGRAQASSNSGQSGGRVGKGDDGTPEPGASGGSDESGGPRLGVLAEAAQREDGTRVDFE
jgi:hypothetical protein